MERPDFVLGARVVDFGKVIDDDLAHGFTLVAKSPWGKKESQRRKKTFPFRGAFWEAFIVRLGHRPGSVRHRLAKNRW